MVRAPSPLFRYGLLALLAAFAAGCVTTPTKGGKPGRRRTPSGRSAPGKRAPSGGAPAAAPRPASDPQAQQKLYDLGMKHYTEENYEEARKAWRQAVNLGPNTDLGQKSRENLKKTEQILSTLKEMNPK